MVRGEQLTERENALYEEVSQVSQSVKSVSQSSQSVSHGGATGGRVGPTILQHTTHTHHVRTSTPPKNNKSPTKPV